MIDKKKKTSFISQARTILVNKFKTIIYLILALIILIILFQFYIYQKEKQVLKLSILFSQAKSNVDVNDFEETMNIVAKKNGIFGMLASLELIEKNLNNKDYEYAYNQYLKLIKRNELEKIYNSVIALHGAYNLIEHISRKNISNLLSFVDESYVSFIGHKNELEFLLSIKNNNLARREELSDKILNNSIISENIKERVRKLNEFEKYH